jgi:hypothetical protein
MSGDVHGGFFSAAARRSAAASSMVISLPNVDVAIVLSPFCIWRFAACYRFQACRRASARSFLIPLYTSRAMGSTGF